MKSLYMGPGNGSSVSMAAADGPKFTFLWKFGSVFAASTLLEEWASLDPEQAHEADDVGDSRKFFQY